MLDETARRSAPALPVFDRHFFDGQQTFTRIGTGAIGGKAHGLALMHQRLVHHFAEHPVRGVTVDVPTLTVIAGGLFEQFIEQNKLQDVAFSDTRDELIAHAFQKAELPAQLVGDLRALVVQVHSPLAVRSSSFLEDAMYQPFASVYTTKMIPNNQFDADTRFRKLVEAVKFVYASTFFRDAKNYIRATDHTTADERMAVIIQEVVGQRHGNRFYPHVSGVARSYNFYPLGHAKPEDGVVDLALGLGKSIVDDARAWTYSPSNPRANPPYNSPRDLLKQTQAEFWAVNMGPPPDYNPIKETEYLQQFGLADAEHDGVLNLLCSTYNPQDDRLEPGVSGGGPRVLTFAPLLVLRQVPLNDVVRQVLTLCEEVVGTAVETEWAAVLDPRRGVPARFGFLQVRPMVVSDEVVAVAPEELDGDRVLVGSEIVLGNGELDTICDVVYVKPETFSTLKTLLIAGEIETINQELLGRKRPYVLIGFGRWGSSDPSLGIPVNFGQISGAKVMVEAVLPEMPVTLSQGSHFFHNITSFRIIYFSVLQRERHTIDWAWLARQTPQRETQFVRWVTTETPLVVKVDGRSGRGVIRR